MSEITRRLTVAELSQRILEMARTGVYRASVFEAFQPVATKKQISQAIRHAKQFGLHSVAKLRDVELGTYYQVDAVKCQSLQQIVQTAVPLESPEDLLKRTTTAMLTIQRMLAVAGGGAIALFGSGAFCFITGKPQLGWGLLAGAASAIGVWVLQKAVAKRVISE